MKGDTVTDARVGLGAVAPTVLLVDKAAKALIGSKLDDAALDAAAAACSAACKPIDDKRGTIKYRTKIAGVLLKRAALIARDRINGIEHRGHAVSQWPRSTSRPPSTARRPSSSATPTRPCSTCCATISA